MKRKGIILAGGIGSRLYPLTNVVSKQLMPIYDKPLIYYPLSTLMLAGIREIAIISTLRDLAHFKQLLGTGEQLGLSFTYIQQLNPDGVAQALILAEDFLNNDPSALILGDNLFYGDQINKTISAIDEYKIGATIFAYRVSNPEAYGVIEFDTDNKVISIEEKPRNPKSNYALVGLYFYDNNGSYYAKQLKPSIRNELEIVDLNKIYLEINQLDVKLFGRGNAWLDTGTHSDLLNAAQFVKTIEKRQGLKIACIEEIAYKLGYINTEQLTKLAVPLLKSGYGRYLLDVLNEG